MTHSERIIALRDSWVLARPTRVVRTTELGGFAPIQVAFLSGGVEIVSTRGQSETDALAQALTVLAAYGEVVL